MDLRKCSRCGFRGELNQFEAIGEGKRYDLCRDCWIEVREERLGAVAIEVDGAELSYLSIDVSDADFTKILAFIRDTINMGDKVATAIAGVGKIPHMQKASKTQLVYKR